MSQSCCCFYCRRGWLTDTQKLMFLSSLHSKHRTLKQRRIDKELRLVIGQKIFTKWKKKSVAICVCLIQFSCFPSKSPGQQASWEWLDRCTGPGGSLPGSAHEPHRWETAQNLSYIFPSQKALCKSSCKIFPILPYPHSWVNNLCCCCDCSYLLHNLLGFMMQKGIVSEWVNK